MLDILISGGKVLRGFRDSQEESINLGIKDGRIAFLGRSHPEAKKHIKLTEKHLVLPGFIDVHNHSDLELLAIPTADSSIRQGVTTIIVGNCGFSAAPLPDTARRWVLDQLEKLRLKFSERDLWRTFEEYLKTLPPLAINVGFLVGHGNLRELVLGLEDKRAGEEDVLGMRKHLEKALEEGALGMSLGLIYPPGIFSSTDELIELAKLVASYGGIVASHQRSEGRALFQALEESYRIAKYSGVRFQVSHLKAARPAWGKAEEVVSFLKGAREEVDIWADQYPYEYSSTGLSALFPRELQEGGGERIWRIARENPKELVKVLKEVDHTPFEGIYISQSFSHPEVEGLSIAEISKRWDMEPEEVVVKLIGDEGGDLAAIYHIMIWEDVSRILQEPFIALSSDSSVRRDTSPGKPHPRAFGAFAKFLQMALRGEYPLSLAVYKMSELPARIFRLEGRGAIDIGRWADLLVINTEEFRDNATMKEPKRYPSGVEYVFVNGELVVEKGQLTDNRPGKQLLRS